MNQNIENYGDCRREYFENLAKTYIPNITENENMIVGRGRKGRVPDVVVFGTGMKRACIEKHASLPHYVIYRDGSVRQYVSLSDASDVFETSLLAFHKNYYAAGRGLAACRRDNAALYSVSVLFEGDCITDNQILSAAALLRLICLKILRLYGKKLPLDNNHIISAADLSCEYVCNFDTGIVTELCKIRPV